MTDDRFVAPAPLRPLLDRAVALARERGCALYIVGGSVRDALLGRPMRDLDLAVDRDAMTFAQSLASKLAGHFVTLDGEQAIARIVLDDGPVGYIDVARLQGTLENDLRRRDFPVDAMAVALPEARLIDVTGGLDDLRAGVVRMTSTAALDADPLRLLRGARIGAELGFRIDPATEGAIRERAHLLGNPAAERKRDELARIFALPDATAGVRLLDSLGLLDVLLPEVTFGRGVTQPGGWHVYDVLEHNMHTVAALDEMIAALVDGDSPPATREPGRSFAAAFAWCREDLRAYLDDELSEGRTRAAVLKLTGLLHDVAKPQTRTLDEHGAHFYGHSDQGATIAARVMRRLRFSAREVRFVSLLVAEHLRPVQLAAVGEAPTRRALYRFYRDLGDAVPAVLLLALADAAASRGERLDDRPRHVAYMNSLLVRSREEEGIVDAPRLLTGRDIMQELGIPEGPRIGQLLEALREAQAAGEVTDRRAALAFVRSGAHRPKRRAEGELKHP